MTWFSERSGGWGQATPWSRFTKPDHRRMSPSGTSRSTDPPVTSGLSDAAEESSGASDRTSGLRPRPLTEGRDVEETTGNTDPGPLETEAAGTGVPEGGSGTEGPGAAFPGVTRTIGTGPDQDVSVEKIATVYAEAFLSAAQRTTGDVPSHCEELEDFVLEILDAYPEYEKILSSGLVNAEEKGQLLDRTLGPAATRGELSRLSLNFLKVLAKHGRLDCLRAVVRAVRSLHEESLGRVRVTVTTPSPITDDLAQRLLSGIAPLAGGEPILETRVDPELIGGVVVRVGDTVYDASILTQLKNLREQLIQRSTHEIQSRRDRFRNPE
ncbi:MAG: ATP synthase F1 subunit delta [Planctomycetia bacterium]|nr:ATP synthase F1 subunit delta [Planctomycetia bacterium]